MSRYMGKDLLTWEPKARYESGVKKLKSILGNNEADGVERKIRLRT